MSFLLGLPIFRGYVKFQGSNNNWWWWVVHRLWDDGEKKWTFFKTLDLNRSFSVLRLTVPLIHLWPLNDKQNWKNCVHENWISWKFNKQQSIGKIHHHPSKNLRVSFLGGGFNPSEKYDRQNGNLPQTGLKIKNIWVATTKIWITWIFVWISAKQKVQICACQGTHGTHQRTGHFHQLPKQIPRELKNQQLAGVHVKLLCHINPIQIQYQKINFYWNLWRSPHCVH